MNKMYLTHADVEYFVEKMHEEIQRDFQPKTSILVYPVPRGGIPIAYLLLKQNGGYSIVNSPDEADIIVDDLIDSGATRERFSKPFHAAFDKQAGFHNKWIVFPWEVSNDKDESITDNVTRLLQYIGEDVTREGLRDTPARVAKAWQEWTEGYRVNIPELFTSFSDGAERYDQMIVIKDIPFYSHCEHHLAPFFGTATVAYIPEKRIVGLSKLNRVVNAYAKRLQVQERLTDQIADCLMENLRPVGVGVSVKARHLCMESRGISQQGHHTVTTALRGTFMSDSQCRAEFLSMVK